MIKPWSFDFLYAPAADGGEVAPRTATAVFDRGIALWKRMETLGFEGIFFSEHHFGLSYSPSPNLLIAAIAHSTARLRLGTMGVVLPLYQPWRVRIGAVISVATLVVVAAALAWTFRRPIALRAS